MKQCSKCKQYKPIDEFYKDKRAKDGLYRKCKTCHLSYYHDNIDEIRPKRQAYYRKNRRKIIDKARVRYHQNPDNKKEYDKKYRKTKQGKKVHYRAMDKWLASDDGPQKRLANIALNNAVKLGKIAPISSQVCSVCGEQAAHYHHHNGYDKQHWLDVIPMCHQHHWEIHHKN